MRLVYVRQMCHTEARRLEFHTAHTALLERLEDVSGLSDAHKSHLALEIAAFKALFDDFDKV